MNYELFALLSFPATFAALAILERVFPARPLVQVAWWKSKGLVFFLIMGAISMFVPLLWMDFVAAHRLIDLSGAGIVGGTIIAFVGTQFFTYWWHRSMHGNSALWRVFHQMHHSAERIDIYGGVYFHPLDVCGFLFFQTAVPFLVLGVRPEAAVLAGAIGTFYALFQHTNIKTPRWLGLVIQRPEAHSLHHARGVHAFNYGDLPLWDMAFGTYRNPARFHAEAGFWDGASRRMGSMLAFRDIAQLPVEQPAIEQTIGERQRHGVAA